MKHGVVAVALLLGLMSVSMLMASSLPSLASPVVPAPANAVARQSATPYGVIGVKIVMGERPTRYSPDFQSVYDSPVHYQPLSNQTVDITQDAQAPAAGSGRTDANGVVEFIVHEGGTYTVDVVNTDFVLRIPVEAAVGSTVTVSVTVNRPVYSADFAEFSSTSAPSPQGFEQSVWLSTPLPGDLSGGHPGSFPGTGNFTTFEVRYASHGPDQSVILDVPAVVASETAINGRAWLQLTLLKPVDTEGVVQASIVTYSATYSVSVTRSQG